MVRVTAALRTLASVFAASQLYRPAWCRPTLRITRELRLVTTPALLFCTTWRPCKHLPVTHAQISSPRAGSHTVQDS
ncbi:hypothetical protein E2C01_007869 [Portunus trituberculatus]|uniref:Secreted protein n=1 Tax=Portunus trituberculatus TaxID=210409 RepID=A0A5B7D3I4_PORTR|nr:hypothetical protein [Portunus trituberculatus]